MKSNQPSKPSNQQSDRQSYNKYVIFSALAFQWIGVFVLLSLGGNWLDKRLENHFPIYTLAGVFVALFVIFYTLFRYINRPNGD